MCAVVFLRLEEFLDNKTHNITVPLEPQGEIVGTVSTWGVRDLVGISWKGEAGRMTLVMGG